MVLVKGVGDIPTGYIAKQQIANEMQSRHWGKHGSHVTRQHGLAHDTNTMFTSSLGRKARHTSPEKHHAPV
jgi:hypothetical protein